MISYSLHDFSGIYQYNDFMEDRGIVIYKNENNEIDIDVKLQDGAVWLDQKSIATLFDVNVPAISKYISNIYDEEKFDYMLPNPPFEVAWEKVQKNEFEKESDVLLKEALK